MALIQKEAQPKSQEHKLDNVNIEGIENVNYEVEDLYIDAEKYKQVTQEEIDAMAAELDECIQCHKIEREARHEKLKRGGRSKNNRIDLSPEEIHTKTDEELITIFHQNQKEKNYHVHQQYEKVLFKMKKHRINDQELEMLEKWREMLDRKKETIERENERNAQKFVDKMRRRAAHVKPASDEF